MEQAKKANEEKEMKEMQECTFKPQTNKHRVNLSQFLNQPKGFEESINRLRKQYQEKEQKKLEEEKKVTGDRYSRERLI